MNTYLEKIQQLQPLEYQTQFERGFMMGLEIVIEIISWHIKNFNDSNTG